MAPLSLGRKHSMGATMMQRISHKTRQQGFTLIETMIAIAIMSIGILTLLAAFATAVGSTEFSEDNLIARQKALQALESVYTARNTQQISFTQIANTTSGGIFTTGPTQLLCAGPDGLVNTTDDVACPASGPCAAGPECVVLPGKDGILGTADDIGLSLANFTRQISITNALNSDGTTNQTLKIVVITITYSTSGGTAGASAAAHTYTVSALVSSAH
jgi:prepilin-type N-terminal cleavage/methylation domain-containing protein